MTTTTSQRSGPNRLTLPVALLLPLGLAVGCGSDDSTDHPQEPSTTVDEQEDTMQRSSHNPWTWSVELGFNQAELVEGGHDVLYLAGQSAMGADGTPQHAGDMAAQITLALDNLEAVLAEAGMDLADIVRLNTYTTDIDAMFASYGLVAERLGAAGVQPPGSLLGVSRLAYPELLVEFEATAVR